MTDRDSTASSAPSLNAALQGVGSQCHNPAALPPEMTWYTPYTRLGGPQVRSGQVRKSRPYQDSIPELSSLQKVDDHREINSRANCEKICIHLNVESNCDNALRTAVYDNAITAMLKHRRC
jgi:hypothetical protein